VDTTPKYWAFVSYSHHDKRWGDWLHRSLEAYRVPRLLAGRPSRDGKVPKRLFPIFRDREELPTAADLGGNITTALAQSRYLVVICSPHASASRWVGEEIKTFKLLGREDRLLCLIVGGEPNASDRPELAAQECFPESLRFGVTPDGTIVRTQRFEPIAADARPGADGREKAKVKVLAGLLGVNFDDLWQREKRRQRWRWVRRVAGAAALVAIIAGTAYKVSREAGIRDNIDLGRQELLRGRPAQALAYVSAAYSDGGDGSAIRFLLQQARLALPRVSQDQHTMGVFSASFNRDGTRVVTASEDRTAKIWDAASGRCLATLRHPACVNSAVFSPDGRQILTACNDGTARVWNASATGSPQPIASLVHGLYAVYPAVFDPTGGFIATASQDGTAKVWRSDGFALVFSYTGHRRAINSLQFNRAGTEIVTASDDGTARVWRATDGATVSALGEAGAGGLRFALFSPDGRRVATCARNGEVRLWSVEGPAIATLSGHAAYVRRAAFCSDGSRLVTASADGTARIWDGATGRFILSLDHEQQAERRTVFDTVFSPDNGIIATAGADGLAKLWDAGTGRLLRTLDCRGEVVYGVEFSHDGSRLSTAGDKGLASIWNIADPLSTGSLVSLDGGRSASKAGGSSPRSEGDPSLAHILSGHGGYVAVARFSSDGRGILTVDEAGKVRLWSTAGGGLTAVLPTGREQVNDAAFDEAGRCVVTGGEGGTVEIWNIDGASPEQRFQVAAFHGSVRSVQFVPRQPLIAAAGEERDVGPGGAVQFHQTVKLYDPPGLDFRAVSGSDPRFSIDGQYMVTLGDGNVARLWRPDGSPVAVLSGHAGPVNSARFDRRGHRVVTAGDDGAVIVWDVAGHPLLPPLRGHGDHGLFFAAFSPDDRYLVSLGSDNKAKVWDAQNGRAVAVLEGEQKYIVSPEYRSPLWPAAVFSADGALVATRSHEPAVMIWDLASGRMLRRFAGHTGNVSAVAFSPAGGWLLTGAQDGTACLWDIGYETGTPGEIARLVDEKVPWRVEGGKLVSLSPGSAHN